MLKVSLMIACWCAFTLNAANLLKNPSFEKADPVKSQLPESWQTHQLFSLADHHFVDESSASDGKKSVRITNSNPALDIKAYLLWRQSGLGPSLQNINAGTLMELSFYVKSDEENVKFRFYMEGMKEDSIAGGFISPIYNASPGEWRQYRYTFTLPEKKFTSAYVCVQLISEGTIWIDDGYLGPASDAPQPKISLPEDKNRLLNNSAETVNSTGDALHWLKIQNNIQGSFHHTDKTQAHGGTHSLKIECADTALNANNFLLYAQRGVEARLADCPPGTLMTLSLWANVNSNPSTKFRIYVEMRAKGKFIGTFISKPLTVYANWGKVTLPFTMPDIVPDSVSVNLQLLTPGTVWFDDVELHKNDDLPKQDMAGLLPSGNYARAILPTGHLLAPDLVHELAIDAKLSPNDPLSVELQHASGATIKTFNAVKDRLSLPPLAAGSYRLRYRAGAVEDYDYFKVGAPSGVTFDSQRRMSINGEKFFPIVIFTPAMKQEALEAYAKAGANAITFSNLTSNAAAARYLAATAKEYGMKVFSWSNYGDNKLPDDEFQAKLNEEIATARTLDNFIGWVDDESEHREIPLSQIERAYSKLFTDAPEYIFWQNHAPRLTDRAKIHESADNVRRYTRRCDVTGIDIYPVPEGGGHSNLANRSISSVGDYTDLVMESGFKNKPVWMILQASSWNEFSQKAPTAASPRPTEKEFRFMVWNAITHGATGIALFGGLNYYGEDYMQEIGRVLHELNAVAPVLLHGQMETLTTPHQNLRAVRYVLNGDELLILVNEGKQDITATFEPQNGKAWFLLPDNTPVKTNTFTLKANDVIILSSTPRPYQPGNYKSTETPKNGKLMTVPFVAEWVAHPQLVRTPNTTTIAKQVLQLTDVPDDFPVRMTGDDEWKIFVNGQKAGSGFGHTAVHQYNIAPFLKRGENLIEFELYNINGPSGIIFEGVQTPVPFQSGPNTFFAEKDRKEWRKAQSLGVPPVKPWGELNLLIIH